MNIKQCFVLAGGCLIGSLACLGVVGDLNQQAQGFTAIADELRSLNQRAAVIEARAVVSKGRAAELSKRYEQQSLGLPDLEVENSLLVDDILSREDGHTVCRRGMDRQPLATCQPRSLTELKNSHRHLEAVLRAKQSEWTSTGEQLESATMIAESERRLADTLTNEAFVTVMRQYQYGRLTAAEATVDKAPAALAKSADRLHSRRLAVSALFALLTAGWITSLVVIGNKQINNKKGAQ